MERVQDNQLNTTRFFCVAKGGSSFPDADKISMCFVVNHEPGALYEVIRVFAQRGINMLKLESRPIRGRRLFVHCFYIDFDGTDADETQEAIAEVREHCLEVKVLGGYKRAFNERAVMKKIMILLLITVLFRRLCGPANRQRRLCADATAAEEATNSNAFSPTIPSAVNENPADMSAYEGFDDEQNAFVEISLEASLEKIEQGNHALDLLRQRLIVRGASKRFRF